MKETIYVYNSGTISSDGKNMVFKKDRIAPISISWDQVGDAIVHSSHVSIGGEKNFIHLLKIKDKNNTTIHEWRMPNLDTASKARTAIAHYLAVHPTV